MSNAALFAQGLRSLRGDDGATRDPGEAARLFRLAADQGHAEAQVYLGMVLYHEGEGVHGHRDPGEAARYFRLAANQGHAEAQFRLGGCCYSGEGVPRDNGESARYYRLAADQGHAGAQLLYGQTLVVDSADPADVRAGAKLLARAAQCMESLYEEFRPEALNTLRSHADKREVVWACCIGCGATHGLKKCAKCHAARFCGSACMRQMWPTHKRCCARWAEQRDDAPQ
jgi:TPR repeat protein